MSLLQAALLGILQGLTEFLPVSSSGHLVIVPWLLRWPEPSLTFDTIVHLGTLFALLAVFWREIVVLVREWARSVLARRVVGAESRLAWLVVLGSLPAALVGFVGQHLVESILGNPLAVGVLLVMTGLLLFASESLARRQRPLHSMRIADALAVGAAQALAVAPGLSRAGATISAGLLCGLNREDATRYSLLLALPVVAGAAGLQLVKTARLGIGSAEIGTLAAGFAAAAFCGYAAAQFLLRYVRSRGLHPFAYYCVIFGVLVIGLCTLR